MARPVIAVIEDDPATAEMLEDVLADAGYETLTWPQGRDAHLVIRRAQPDLVVLDMWLEDPEAGGMVLGLLELDPATRHIPVVICSAHVDALRERRARLLERNYTLIQKPYHIAEVLNTITTLLAARQSQEPPGKSVSS
jgi:two-component system, NtrC family, nitrogen regulation response regulator NtrX